MEKLSILIPSNRPDGLDAYIESLTRLAKDMSRIELVILIDDDKNYVEYHGKNIIIHKIPVSPLSIAKLQYECYRLCSGDWIMLSNDDVIMETQDWDEIIFQTVNQFPFKDEVALLYPDDGMFGHSLACFPIISRKVIEATNMFPMPYRRYKVDDTIFQIFPEHRRMFLGNIRQPHLNDKGESGFKFSDGRIYPIEPEAAAWDNDIWAKEHSNRLRMKHLLLKMSGDIVTPGSDIKVMIAVPTGEMARRASFYDYFNILDKPDNCLMTFTHAQSPARGRNMAIEQALSCDCTHIFFVDDDVEVKSDTLMRLLKHDVDMVTAVYCRRSFPHEPYLFNKRKEDNSVMQWIPHDHQKGLHPIVATGLGCVLIKTDVFRGMEKPWITLGEYTKDEWCDDVSFYNRALDAGFKLYVDLDVSVGHQCSLTVFWEKMNAKWSVSYDTSGSTRVNFPAPRPN